jgi:hypothetical protein
MISMVSLYYIFFCGLAHRLLVQLNEKEDQVRKASLLAMVALHAASGLEIR